MILAPTRPPLVKVAGPTMCVSRPTPPPDGSQHHHHDDMVMLMLMMIMMIMMINMRTNNVRGSQLEPPDGFEHGHHDYHPYYCRHPDHNGEKIVTSRVFFGS